MIINSIKITDVSIYVRVAAVIVVIVLHSPLNFSQNNNSIEMGSLTVKLTGFANDNGNCRFALDNSKEVYESEDSVFVGRLLPIIDSVATFTIDSLQYGTYAIKVFHDENSDGELDTNIFGIPSEDYGFSNNASGWFGPPSWEKSKFLFNEKEMTVEISVD
jgi:uncharacterized protein (DUF2141 family)